MVATLPQPLSCLYCHASPKIKDHQVAVDAACRNAKDNTPHTARMAHDQALARVMQYLLTDDTQVYKQFVENDSFKRSVSDMVYAITNP